MDLKAERLLGWMVAVRRWRRAAGGVALVAAMSHAHATAQEGENLPGPEAAGPPLIVAAQASADLSSITVSGLNFGNETPTVSLGLSALTVTMVQPAGVKTGDADMVTAALPAGVAPGTYLLALTRAGDKELAVFYVAVVPLGAVYQ